ncbi:MAG TPA: alpha/beta hydrolase [Pseudomonadales bacterium]|nr:alpha/beta hydrolase [Pseudomonadales bacterium]
MTEPVRHTVRSSGVNLNVLTLGDSANPPLVFVHGIRDVAASLMVIAEPFADRWYVVLPELRGHGDSDNSNYYAIWQFIYDLHRVVEALDLEQPVVVGHSLGGQIAAHHAAMFPEEVRALAIVEGLGPPERLRDSDPDARLIAQRQQLLATMELPEHSRPLPSIEFAAQRLRANNPRLSEQRAYWLADHGTAIAADGNRYWKFDQRVTQIWLSTDPALNRQRWRQVQCATLIVTADLAHEYWTAQMPIDGWDGRFNEGDLAERLRSFRNAAHVRIANAGHMVHFDAPEMLVDAIERFLQRVVGPSRARRP